MEIENISKPTSKATKITVVEVACPDCGNLFVPSQTKTLKCGTCISKNNDISVGITRQAVLNWCRYCKRFQRPPWVYCEYESKELLSICLKKIRGLNKVKLIDAAFRWTEEHSRRVRVELTVQKEISDSIALQQTFETEFTVHYGQCDDCKKEFTPHTWGSCIQVRQRALHKKTFLYLEQVMLKLGIHSKAQKIEEEPDGLNFFFKNKNHSNGVLEFFHSNVPNTVKDSKELVSHDIHEGTYSYKYSTILQIPKVCRDDLLILPKQLCNELGGVNALGVCYKITSVIHCYDPVTLRVYDLIGKQWFAFEEDIIVVPFRGQSTKFMIQDIELDLEKATQLNTTFSNIQDKFANCEVQRLSDGQVFCCSTHLGNILKHGDSAIGFDISSVNCTEDLTAIKPQKRLPDVVQIRKVYDEKYRKKKKIWKLKRLDIDEGDFGGPKKRTEERKKMDLEEFEEELEQSKALRKHVNLYRDEEGIKEKLAKAQKRLEAKKGDPEQIIENDDESDWEDDLGENNAEMIQLEELMGELVLEEKTDADHERAIDDLLREVEKVRVTKE